MQSELETSVVPSSLDSLSHCFQTGYICWIVLLFLWTVTRVRRLRSLRIANIFLCFTALGIGSFKRHWVFFSSDLPSRREFYLQRPDVQGKKLKSVVADGAWDYWRNYLRFKLCYFFIVLFSHTCNALRNNNPIIKNDILLRIID